MGQLCLTFISLYGVVGGPEKGPLGGQHCLVVYLVTDFGSSERACLTAVWTSLDDCILLLL